jgi:hypothetical protein
MVCCTAKESFQVRSLTSSATNSALRCCRTLCFEESSSQSSRSSLSRLLDFSLILRFHIMLTVLDCSSVLPSQEGLQAHRESSGVHTA